MNTVIMQKLVLILCQNETLSLDQILQAFFTKYILSCNDFTCSFFTSVHISDIPNLQVFFALFHNCFRFIALTIFLCKNKNTYSQILIKIIITTKQWYRKFSFYYFVRHSRIWLLENNRTINNVWFINTK
jgi:hypothetical protein